jgi:D-alanyl-D-alanine carboxypeptidase (penicillin-binding protein 5/6)
MLLAVLLVPAVAPPAAAIDTSARQALVVDAATGAVLFEKNADEPMAPASMSKMMTAYVVLEQIAAGKLTLDDIFVVSDNAWRVGGAASGGSTMFLEPGQEVRVEDLLRGVIVQSGNDASVVLAEGVAGSEAAFAEMMNRQAREMGMRDTTFRNASGLPDPQHLTTARDLAILAAHTIADHPDTYPYYAEKSFTYNGIRQGNRNPLLYREMGVDGLKTGHTSVSGFGLAASAVRGDRRLIVVLNGLPSMQSRADESQRMLDYGFQTFDNYALFDAGEAVAEARMWYGAAPTVALVTPRPVVVTLPRSARPQMRVAVTYEGPVPAPVAAGDRLALLRITAPNVAPVERVLLAGSDVAKLGLLGRLTFALDHYVDRVLN